MTTSRGARLAAILFLFAAISLARLMIEPASAGVMYLLVAPIGLLAIELGLRGGILGAILSSLLFFAWVVVADPNLSLLAVGSRVATFFIVGLATGHIAEQRRLQQDIDNRRREARRQHEQGLELHEDIVQGLVVAKMALELGQIEKANDVLADTLRKAKGIVMSQLDDDVAISRGAPDTET